MAEVVYWLRLAFESLGQAVRVPYRYYADIGWTKLEHVIGCREVQLKAVMTRNKIRSCFKPP